MHLKGKAFPVPSPSTISLYHERCPMRFSSYVYRQRSREILTHFSRPSLYHKRHREPARRDGSRPRDTLHRLSSNIEALGTLYHKGEGRIGGAAKREEVVPTDSQFLQAQGLLTLFGLKHKGPGRIISQMWRENWRCREATKDRSDWS